MRMGHPANAEKLPVQLQVRGKIGRGPQVSFDDRAFEIRNNHLSCGQFLVGDTAGLNGNESFCAIDSAGVSECVEDKAAPNEFKICFQHLFAQRLKQHWENAGPECQISVGEYYFLVNVYATEH